MPTLTKALKGHLTAAHGLAADASDDAAQKLIGQKMVSGELTMDRLVELSNVADPTDPSKAVEEMVAKQVAAEMAKQRMGNPGTILGGTYASPNPAALYAKAAEFSAFGSEPIRIRVKSAAESYSMSTKRAVYPDLNHYKRPHPLAGQTVTHCGRAMDETSQYGKALIGAWFKYLVIKNNYSGAPEPGCKLTEHERDLILYAAHEGLWSGYVGRLSNDEGYEANHPNTVNQSRMTEWQVKALLDDSGPSGSGGIEITPIEFDDAIVTFPVLYGELYPLVNVVPVTRGRRIKGGSIGNPTFTWGTADGTAIGLFNTAAFITAFDTTIFPAVGAMVIGLDFLEDSPTAVGDVIVRNYGLKAMETLDAVIATGDGVTQPQGIFTNANTTSVLSDNSTAGPPTIGDYEQLYFAIPKQFRTEAGARGVYIANDTSYQRARSIPVGPFDQRRVFGMEQSDYQLFGRDYKVQNTTVPNNKQAFAMMNRYRMYRRLGLTVRQETAGQTLSLANERLLVLRMRYGGQLELGAAASVMTTAQS